jgi:hypothetical protein
MTRRGTMTAAARAVREHAGPPARDWQTVLLRVAGAGLLIAAGAIHLDLYLTGYRTIPAIGRLFLLQVIAAFGLVPAVLAIPRRLVIPRPLAAAGASRLRPRYPGRLPLVGLDRGVRVHRGPHDRGHRRRRGGGSRLCGTGRRRIATGTPRFGAAT